MIDVPRDDLVLMMEAGYIYLAMGKLSEARQVFEGISVLAPQNEIPLVAISNVYFAQKKYLQAIRTLKEAVELNPKSAFAKSHLGEAYLFYGKKDEAIETLNEASKLDPSGKPGDFARSLLELIKTGYDPVALTKQAKEMKKGAK
ncbi:tetratricopeptide repeat protein [bacterium]|nr:tetratricopeptide repeat protein [bacterium]